MKNDVVESVLTVEGDVPAFECELSTALFDLTLSKCVGDKIFIYPHYVDDEIAGIVIEDENMQVVLAGNE